MLPWHGDDRIASLTLSLRAARATGSVLMVDFDAIRLDAQIRAFASALRAVHKSKSWDYVAPLAAHGWATLESSAKWESVRARVRTHWLDLEQARHTRHAD